MNFILSKDLYLLEDNNMNIEEHIIDHEVRLRCIERDLKALRNLLKWNLSAALTSVVIPLFIIHYFGK